MITINIYYESKNDNALKFAEEMIERGIVEKIRSRKGNIRYDYFISLDNKNLLLLIDSWESQKYLDEHHTSPIMQEIIKLREKYDLKMTVERYRNDGENISELDRKYIRI